MEAKIAFRLGYYAGLRRAEVCRLQWRDVDFAEAMLQVRKGKRGRARQVPIAPLLLAYLEAHRDGAGAKRPNVVRVKDDSQLSQWFRRAMDKAGAAGAVDQETARGLHFHSLRHGFARYHLNDRKISIPVVSAWLGHTNVVTTLSVYSGITGGMYADLME